MPMRLFVILSCLVSGRVVLAAELTFKDRFVEALVRQVPGILDDYDAKTGHFGKGVWICRDQDQMYPLAVAYASKAPGNRYYKDPKLLEVLMKAGDALAADMDKDGKWVFRKKDNSTWGMIRMPWTYSRWIRTFQLIRDDMPADRRAAWEMALTLGYGGIARDDMKSLHNIPTHHAMGLYIAGKTLSRPEWCRQAADFLHKVIASQHEGGYWSEGIGPVVHYGAVYVDALGIYFALSGDEAALDALKKASMFYARFTYPNGSCVETIDLRNPYESRVERGSPGFSVTPEGRGWLARQWALAGDKPFEPDRLASFILYGREGEAAEPAVSGSGLSVMTEGGVDHAAVLRKGPWFVALSAFTSPIEKSRWHQDRQNLVSVYHDKVGLILGGGNTKLQPAWSSFTVGDESLLRHKAGDTSPNFLPTGPLLHVPSAATLVREPSAGLDLKYGDETCRVRVEPKDDRTLLYTVSSTASSDKPVAAHLTLLPRKSKVLKTGGGQKHTLGDEPIALSAAQVGGAVSYAGFRLRLPPTASLQWPALPHNPYRKDGRAEPSEGRISIRIPFDAQHREHVIALEIE